MDLDEYQRHALATDQKAAVPGTEVLVPLLGLAGEVGELLSEYKKHLRDGEAHRLFESRVSEELGDILWYVAAVAHRFDLELGSVATLNLKKCRSNWAPDSAKGSVHGRFDDGFPRGEQFPAKFIIDFEELNHDEGLRVRAWLQERQMGQDLTDNAFQHDGYRFHDVFHLACVAGLGWSPVTRRNLGLKRRSDPLIDEVEDGGRATVIEEGITALVFSYAIEHDWLEGVRRIDHDILKVIKKMTSHLEVSACSIAEWEHTVLRAYPVWRQVLRKRGGSVEVDLESRSIRLVS